MVNIKRLLGNITDQIKEAQIKLGYAKETMRLYYPVEELACMLGTERSLDVRDMRQLLCESFSDSCQGSGLGELSFSVSAGRIEVSIPPEGVEYVHKFVEASPFLIDIVRLFGSNHHASLDEIRAVFQKYSDAYTCRQMEPDSDFDYVMYFSDGSIDEYCYCIKTEMGHTIYHRFTRESYLLNGWEL